MNQSPSAPSAHTADVIVIGTGLAGLSAGIAFAQSGISTLIVGPRLDADRAARDTRTTALFTPSIDVLKNLGLWAQLAAIATPLAAIRVIDDTGAIWRAPEVLFHARELGLDAFGYNFENTPLLVALNERARCQPHLTMIEGEAVPGAASVGRAVVATRAGHTLEARLIVAADGRRSAFRAAAGLRTREWSYPQTAITLRFAHSRPHDDISTELHRPAGPLTTVPLAGNWSSLVWVETPEEAQRLMDLTPEAFAHVLEDHLQGLLGVIGEMGPRAAFPLSGLIAEPLGARRTALVGETAHAFPPIGAQGLNLSYRDIATLVDVVVEAAREGRDIGGDEALAAYERARRPDVESRTMMVDVLNRSLFSGALPLHLARGAGMHLINAVRPLKELAMRQGLAPPGRLPSLMRQPDAE